MKDAAELLASRARCTTDPEAARDLIAVALELDPDCPRALVASVDQEELCPVDRARVLRRALRALVRRGTRGGRPDAQLLVDILASLGDVRAESA